MRCGDPTCRFKTGASLMRRKLEPPLVCCCLLPATEGKETETKQSVLFELFQLLGAGVVG